MLGGGVVSFFSEDGEQEVRVKAISRKKPEIRAGGNWLFFEEVIWIGGIGCWIEYEMEDTKLGADKIS